MGRQTSVALSEEDERDFLAFLRAETDVKVFRWSAPSPELLSIPEFLPGGSEHHTFRLWNTAFPWNPEFAQWSPEVQNPHLTSQFHLKNTAGAPVIEYSREAFDNPAAIVHGRVYWNTDFAIYRGPHYDTVAFGRWFDKVVRWLRKNGKRIELTKGWYQYWLPGAWELRSNSAAPDPGVR